MGQNNSRILKAFETLPKCVRVSTLASMDPQEFNYQTYLSPQLGASQLMFTDLIYVENEGQAMRRNAKWQRILSIQKCVQMPSLDETDVQILERTVRICLFNGQKPVSNICTIPMVTSDREKKTWIPCPLNMRKDSRPNELNGDLFIRFSESDPNVYILIEMGISAKKPSTASSATDHGLELSVGWVCVPLYSENGTATPNKTTDYPIYAGNPYEGAVLEQEQPKDETLRGRIQQFISQKVPQMTVRLSNPNKEQTGMLNGLPDNLVGFTGYLPFFNIYWDLLAQALFGNKVASRRGSAFLRQVPIYVAMFPYVADTPLLMEALRVSWNDRVKTIPAAKRKEPEIMRKLYSEHFMKVIYPLTSVLDIIPTGFTPYWLFEKKTPYVLTMLQAVQSDLPRFFSSTEYKFRPLTAREYTCPVRMSTQMLWS